MANFRSHPQTVNINFDFQTQIHKYYASPKSNLLGMHDRRGTILLTRLRVDFSDLRLHRFNHNFNCPSPTCKCLVEEESPEHFLLRCPLFSLRRITLFSNIVSAVNIEILNLPDDHLTRIILFGSNSFNKITNRTLLLITIHFIKYSGRFNKIEAYNMWIFPVNTPYFSPLYVFMPCAFCYIGLIII